MQPIDFGVDIGGEDAHTLMVLDVTPAQWENIRDHGFCVARRLVARRRSLSSR